MADLVNVSQLAVILKTSRMSIYNAIKAGVLTPARREKSGPKFDLANTKDQWEARALYTQVQSNHDGVANRGGRPKKNTPDKGGGESPDGGESALGDLRRGTVHERLVKAKLADTALRAKHREMDLQKKKGELIAVETVRIQGGELGAVLMGALSALPKRLSQVLATMSDPHAIHELLDGEINAMIKVIRAQCGATEEADGEAKAGAV